MKDNYGRKIDYLRISLTDRCNLRCIYCMPEEGVPFRSHESVLRIEEIADFTRRAVKAGIRRVRLTGGAPLVGQGGTATAGPPPGAPRGRGAARAQGRRGPHPRD